MFKIKLKDPSAGNNKDKSQNDKKKPLPKIKIAKPQPPSSASSTSSKQKTKAKQIKLKLKTAGTGISQPVVKKVPRIRVKPTRIPGEGYDSEASDMEDDPLVEEAIVLRLLPDAELDYARHCVETGDFKNFHIKWKDRLRAVIYINHSLYAARLVNLPNIVEAQKTVDKKSIFKTVDISQILQVVKKISSESEIESLTVHEDDVIQDGLTPPLHNVTKSKYRREMTNDHIEKIEAKVDELLRLDDEAEDSQFELIDPESLNAGSSETPMSSTAVSTPRDLPTQGTMASTTTISSGKDHDDDLELELEQVLGEDLLLADGETVQVQDQNGREIRVEEDELEEELEEVEEEEEEEDDEEEESEDDDDDDEDENSDNEQGASRKVEVDEDAQHNALLKDEINELLSTIEQNKTRLEKTSNPLLQSRFIDSINKLEKELENKKRQLKTSEDKTNKKESGNGDAGDQDEEDDDEDQDMGERGDREGDDEDEDEEDEDEGDDEGDDDDDNLDDLFG